jgi:hypothetical protein
MAIAGLRNLCTPAIVYLSLSIVILIIMIIQNLGNVNTFCLGQYSCNVSSTALIFIIEIVYVLFWTWILNLICRAGAPSFAWFLVLFPFILFFALIALLMIS